MLTEEDLPPLIELNDYGGQWETYLQAVYDRYVRDLSGRAVAFKNRPVVLRQAPVLEGKGSGFWHCISEGQIEENRTPDMERCKRIGWIKPVIENWDSPNIDYWQESRYGKIDHVLWWEELFQVVLSERGRDHAGEPMVYLFKTHYLTTRHHQIVKRRKKRDAWKNQHRPD